jgi:hypothetical protein
MAKKLEDGVIAKILAYAERERISFGGLMLIVVGLYGGQYAQLPSAAW